MAPHLKRLESYLSITPTALPVLNKIQAQGELCA